MNRVVLCGRLVRDAEVRYAAGEKPLAIARYTLAVDRVGAKKNGAKEQQTADFISCVAFGKDGEFVEKYLSKGMKILVEGEIRTGSYKDKDGKSIYTTDVVVTRHEFVEKKEGAAPAKAPASDEYAQCIPFN